MVDTDLPGSEDGWMYASYDFGELRRGLTEGSVQIRGEKLTAEFSVRWRRWVRGRVRVEGAIIADRQIMEVRPGTSVGGYIGSSLPESAVLCEGWLTVRRGNIWVASWVVLVTGAKEKTCALLYCDGPETMRLRDVVNCPPSPLGTTSRPPISPFHAGSIGRDEVERCFGLGTGEPCEGTLHRATNPSDRARWEKALAAAFSDVNKEECEVEASEEGKLQPGQLRILILSAAGLAAVDGDTSDPYATLEIKTGQTTFYKKTRSIRKTINPAWNTEFRFEQIWMDSTDVKIARSPVLCVICFNTSPHTRIA